MKRMLSHENFMSRSLWSRVSMSPLKQRRAIFWWTGSSLTSPSLPRTRMVRL
uniref:Uncharacterized protein n=1 Tax=Anguilla anguilla TaxID=7936 RepID=A0A0E9XS80_ANGAN